MPVQWAKVVDGYDELVAQLNERRAGKTVVCTIGSWDPLHRGHVEYLKKAKERGDILVVGVDSDIAYQRYKGKAPLFPQEDRMVILAAIGYVDIVTLIHDVDDAGEWQFALIKATLPDIFFCNYQSFPEAQRKQLAQLVTLEVVNIQTPEFTSVVAVDEMKSIVRREKELTLKLRQWAFLLLVTCLSASIVTTLSMVVCTAFRWAQLSDAILGGLIAKTIPEVFGMMYIVVKYLFPTTENKKSTAAHS